MRSSLLQFPSHFLYFFSAFNLVHQFQVTEKYLTKVRHLTSSQKERTKNTFIFIMWKSSLVEIAKRARKTSAPPALQSVVKNVVADSQVPQVAALHQAGAIFSQTSEALVASQADFQTTLRSSILQSSLTSAEPLLRAADDTNTLLQQAQKLPFLYAQEAFCTLVKAGEIQLAIQLVSFWQFKRPKSLKSSRRKAKKELLSTIQTLEGLQDVTTLKALISLLSDSLKEQVFAENKTFTAVALTHVSSGPPRMQNRLFSLLGVAETSHVLTSAVEAAFRMGKGDGLSVFEKVLLADQCATCARSAITPRGTPHLPFPLYRQLQSLQEEEKLDADFIRQVCPELTAKLVHPSHYCTLDFLALTTEEARYIADNWKTREAFSSLSSASTAEATAWQRLLRCALPQSPALQSVEENILLLSLQTRKSAQVPSTDEQTRIKLTSSVNRLLRSPENPVRRFVALTLLKNRNLVAALKISPVKVASVYAGSFYSKGSVDPALCTLCGIVARRLSRKGCHQEAARLLWNHLSVDCPATRRFFRANPGAVDFAVLSMSVAMRDACDNGGGQKWMGYRSLALLTHAALSSDRLTVLHCVPVCVHAMECGVPFAAINGALAGIFHDDPTLGKWALNLVRLCSRTETVPLRLQQTNCGIASEFRRLLSNLCGANGVLQEKPLIRSASRSKQLVLWGCINDTTTNPRLNALMLATFLCESARDAILNCSFLEKSTGSVAHRDEKGKLPPTAEDVWNWEVAASVASNCTSPESYQAFLKCLRQRNPKLVQRRPMDLDCISALLFSEMDGHDSLSSKQIFTEK